MDLTIQEHRRVEVMHCALVEIEFHVFDGFLNVLLYLLKDVLLF